MNFFRYLRSIFDAKEPPVFKEYRIYEPQPSEQVKHITMTPSEKCYQVIKHYESCRLRAYKDVAGIPTIGWGSILYPDGRKVKMGEGITQEMADYMLKFEVAEKCKGVVKIIPKLKQCQFDACVSLSYNIGLGGFGSSTALRLIKKNPNDPDIGRAIMMWDKAYNPKTKKKESFAGLVARRRSEVWLYFHDEVKYFN
jgi:lysozyme